MAKMPVFDAVNTSFATAGTGGFGIKNDSIGSYSVAIQWIVTIFMILFGVNFNAYYLLFFGSIKKALSMEEVRVYFGIILAAITAITINIYSMCSGVWDAITKSAFQVGSIITTTGFQRQTLTCGHRHQKQYLYCLCLLVHVREVQAVV